VTAARPGPMDITPYRLSVPHSALDDLHRRLGDTRWPATLPGDDWNFGVPTSYLKRLAAAWRDQFDWRRTEARLNAYPQFITAIDGTVRS
jgi:epoxide hydrolase